LNATALLSDLRARGVRLEPQGDKLRVVAPKGVLTPDLRATLAEHKGELLAALQAPCCPACARRAGPPLDISDGCQTHGVTPEQVARWWALAQEMDRTVSFCHCCAGPAPSQALRCRRCEGE
jgi:hypothetical protein